MSDQIKTEQQNEAHISPSELNAGLGIKIGDKVRTGVYVIGEWKPMWLGEIVDQSSDGSSSKVDIGTIHGCAPRTQWEQTSHLRAEPNV